MSVFGVGRRPLVSVVIMTYKRLDLLKGTIASLLAATTYPRERLELVLSDDGSGPELQAEMRKLPCDVFVLSQKNRGLGASSNAGIRVARGEYILHLQDAWRCMGPGDFIEASLDVLAVRPDVGAVRLRGPLGGCLEVEHCEVGCGRAVDVYPCGGLKGTGAYIYSDNPHLKRKSFHEELGYYLEGVPMTVTEIDFCQRFERQDRWRFAWIPGYNVFQHTGEEQTFNPSVLRRKKRERIEKLWLGKTAVGAYRWVRDRVGRHGVIAREGSR